MYWVIDRFHLGTNKSIFKEIVDSRLLDKYDYKISTSMHNQFQSKGVKYFEYTIKNFWNGQF